MRRARKIPDDELFRKEEETSTLQSRGKIIAVSWSSSNISWCDTINESAKGTFDFLKRRCSHPRALRKLMKEIIEHKPDLVVLCTQNESRSSKLVEALQGTFANDSQVSPYLLHYTADRVTLFDTKVAVRTTVFVREDVKEHYLLPDDPRIPAEHTPTAYRNQMYNSDEYGRNASNLVIHFFLPTQNAWMQVQNIHLDPPKSLGIFTPADAGHAIYRDASVALNGYFLNQTWKNLRDLGCRPYIKIVCGDFNTLSPHGGQYDGSTDELKYILDKYKWSDGQLVEAKINYSAGFGRKSDPDCSSERVNESCYIGDRGWVDRILHTANLVPEKYTLIDSKLVTSTAHLPVYAIFR